MQRPTGKAKMMADVWCSMPLSTIFHLHFGGHTINGGQINALYYSYFSHWIGQSIWFSKSRVEKWPLKSIY